MQPTTWSAWEITKLVVPPLIVVVGWGITHLLALRTQRLTLRNQVLDRARVEIVRELRKYQQEMRDQISRMLGIQQRLESDDPSRTRVEVTIPHRDGGASEWALRLEEYEITFPETRSVRIELESRRRREFRRWWHIHADLLECPVDTTAVLARVHEFMDAKDSQISLIEDLIIHLQNASLGPITGNSIPARVPGEGAIERIEMDDRAGQLVIRKLLRTPIP